MESTVLVKAFSILETLAARRESVSLAELTDELGLNKPTIHRVLQDLVALGYVERVSSGVYALSDKLLRMSLDEPTSRLLEAGTVILGELHEYVKETTNLGVLRQDRISYLHVLESPHPLRRVVGTGSMDPFHSTALGRAIVSHLPKERWKRLLGTGKLRRQTPNTVTDKKKLEQMLETARETGYAEEWEENDIGVMCLGVPVMMGDHPIAAVSITAPTARMDEQRQTLVIKKLKQTAKKLAKAVGPA